MTQELPQEIEKKREMELRAAMEMLFFGYRSFTAVGDALLAKRGLGRVHHRILYFVGRDPHLSVAELLATLAVSKQALNAPLRQLVHAGFVSSQEGRHDKRVRELSLTASGRKLEAQITGAQLTQLAEVFNQAGKKSESDWRKVMQLLAE